MKQEREEMTKFKQKLEKESEEVLEENKHLTNTRKFPLPNPNFSVYQIFKSI